MSWLEVQQPRPGMGGIFDSAAQGWGPFTFLSKKEERKEKKDVLKFRLQDEAQTFEQKRLLARDMERSKALEDLREKVNGKLRQLETEANLATGMVLKIRELATNPVLEGDPILGDIDGALADMEKAVVTIQASTVVDVATFDTSDLAGAYSDGQAALIAMRTVTARAQGGLKELAARVQQLKEEGIRARERSQRLADQRRLDVERQRRLEAQRLQEQETRALENERRRRMEIMRQVMEADAELTREKARLRQARADLMDAKSRVAERNARAQEAAIRRSSISTIRAG